MNRLIKVILIALVLLNTKIVWCLDKTDTGFYYPTGTSTIGSNNWLADNCNGNSNYLFKDRYHVGVDIRANLGDLVYPIADGKIVYISKNGWDSPKLDPPINSGVFIEHTTSNGLKFIALYAHVILNTGLATGSKVYAGTSFAKIGYWQYGNHLHFGILPPNVKIPQSNLGAMTCPVAYPYNGFVDPIAFIENNTPYGSTNPPHVVMKFGSDPSVYYVSNGKLWHISDETSYKLLGYRNAGCGNEDWNFLNNYPDSEKSRYEFGLHDVLSIGTLAMIIDKVGPNTCSQRDISRNANKVYVLDYDNQWHWITSETQFNALGYSWNQIVEITQDLFNTKSEGVIYGEVVSGTDYTIALIPGAIGGDDIINDVDLSYYSSGILDGVDLTGMFD